MSNHPKTSTSKLHIKNDQDFKHVGGMFEQMSISRIPATIRDADFRTRGSAHPKTYSAKPKNDKSEKPDWKVVDRDRDRDKTGPWDNVVAFRTCRVAEPGSLPSKHKQAVGTNPSTEVRKGSGDRSSHGL